MFLIKKLWKVTLPPVVSADCINPASSRTGTGFQVIPGKPAPTFAGWIKELEAEFKRSQYGDSGRGFSGI
jgi:hypothetical protein